MKNLHITEKGIAAAKKGCRLNWKSIIAAATVVLGIGAGVVGIGTAINDVKQSQESASVSYQQMMNDQPIETYTANADDLAQYNVVLVKDDVSDAVFDHVATYLEDVGMPVRVVDSSEELNNLDGSEMIVGFTDLKTAENDETVKVIAPNNNNYYNRSDPLAVAMHNSLPHSVLQCGVYEIDPIGNTELTSSNIEKHMDSDIPFVTIAIPEGIDKDTLAKGIGEGLVRAYEYIYKYAGINNKELLDIIRRVEPGDTEYSLQREFGISPSAIPHDGPLQTGVAVVNEKEKSPLDPDVLGVNIAPVAGKTY